MTFWLFLHVSAIGVWIGCIATEAIVEHSVGTGTDRDYVAAVHWPIDVYVEIPAFILVTISGAALWRAVPSDGAVALMAVAGLLAAGCNVACVWVVRARRQARRNADASAYERLDHLQHRLGAVLGVLIAAALGLGIYRLAG